MNLNAELCFKIGKYLNNKGYKSAIISIMNALPPEEIYDLTLLFWDNKGIEFENLSKEDTIREINNVCLAVDTMNDDTKKSIWENYLEANPEERVQRSLE